MKKAGAVLILVCLLAGCGEKNTEIERGLALRTKILQSQSCSFDADIVADYGDKLHKFSVSCKGDNQGNLQFTVTEPEIISGITGIISEKEGKLTFDDVALCFDTLADDQISPVTAPWIFLRTLREGYLSSAGTEGEYIRLSMDDTYEEDALHLDIWLDDMDMPKQAEILYAGRKILSLDVKNFQTV